MRIGIDVGGTNTDAVLVDGMRVLAEIKTSTTADVTAGIVTALRGLVDASGVGADAIQGVMIGTTHFTNAVVEAKRLVSTAAVRLGLPATRALPPIVDWPDRLRDAIGGHVYLCHGGHEFDGREMSPLDRDELRRVAEDVRAKGIRSIAISSVFSPVNAEFEEAAAAVFAEELPDVPVSLSHEIGRIGLLERENATIMNACLRELALHLVAAFRAALAELGIEAPVYLSQNDGTLMSRRLRRAVPGRDVCVAARPTRCAALPCSPGSGTAPSSTSAARRRTSACSSTGSPARRRSSVDIGGVRTNFRMPDVLSIGLGGGSLRPRRRAHDRPRQRRLRAHPTRARLRRRHAHGERHRSRRGPGLVRRRRAPSPASIVASSTVPSPAPSR